MFTYSYLWHTSNDEPLLSIICSHNNHTCSHFSAHGFSRVYSPPGHCQLNKSSSYCKIYDDSFNFLNGIFSFCLIVYVMVIVIYIEVYSSLIYVDFEFSCILDCHMMFMCFSQQVSFILFHYIACDVHVTLSCTYVIWGIWFLY